MPINQLIKNVLQGDNMKFLQCVAWGGLSILLYSATAVAQDAASSAADPQTQNPAPASSKEQAAQEQRKSKDSNKRSTPIEPFVPSEEVSPDRSISFPVDI